MNTKSIPALTPISRLSLKTIATNTEIKHTSSKFNTLELKIRSTNDVNMPEDQEFEKCNIENRQNSQLPNINCIKNNMETETINKNNIGVNEGNSINFEKSATKNKNPVINAMDCKETKPATTDSDPNKNGATINASQNNPYLENNNTESNGVISDSGNSDDMKEQDSRAVPDSTTQVIREKVAQKFNNGEDVLVNHKDGRYYLGTIIAVDLTREQCLVKFGDNTERWSNVKELTRLNSSESDCGPLCVVCKTSDQRDLDKIIVCDKCGRGYHQKCHTPKALNANGNWNCRRCVDQIHHMRKLESKNMRKEIRRNSNTVEIVNPSISNIPTPVSQNQLPYDLSALNWDTYHRVNTEQTYCYCGTNGDWFTQMLQCARCRQWFHERCIGCLQYPLYCGDRFYVFVCSLCNYGTEFLRRLEMKWVDLVHLLIYNLTAFNNTKYYDLDNVIVPYANDNWHALQLSSKMKDISQPDLREQILLALSTNRNRFKCGRENKKKVSIWGLRVRLPPPAPCVTMGFHGVVTDRILRESWKGNKRLQFLDPTPVNRTQNSLMNRSSSFPVAKHAQNSPMINRRQNMVVPLDNNMLAIMTGKAYRQNGNNSDSDSVCSVDYPEELYGKKDEKTDMKCFDTDCANDGFEKKPMNTYKIDVDHDPKIDEPDKRKSDDLKLILKLDISDGSRKRKNLRNSTKTEDGVKTSAKSVCPPTPPTSVSAPPTPPANSFTGSSSNDASYYLTEKSTDSRLEAMDCESKDSDSIVHVKTVFDNLKSEFKNDVCDSSDETSSRGTLDSIIPPPKDFQGKNNPFHSLPKTAGLGKGKSKADRKGKKKNNELELQKQEKLAKEARATPVVGTLKRKLSEKDLLENGDVKRRKIRRSKTRSSLPEASTSSTASKTASYTPMLSSDTKEWPQRSLRSSFNTTIPQPSTPISNCMDYALNGRRLRQRQDITYTEPGRRNSSNARLGQTALPAASLPTSPTNKVTDVCITDLKSSVNMYFGAMNRILSGEKFVVQGRRMNSDGKVQYLIEWEGGPS